MTTSAVVLPDLGGGPVLLSLWHAAPGDAVVEGDRLVEVLVGNAVVDVPAPVSGRLLVRHAGPRDRLTAGQVLGMVEPDPEA
jgi:pyruvate/2-oxoglutarate dehydrogenase complex dihydrolipoamide acyltransferase (E2) component